MIAFYLTFLGIYLYYANSKYFPDYLVRIPLLKSIGFLPVLSGAILLVYQWGWASGLLLSLTVVVLSLSLIQLSAVLGKAYFIGLIVMIHGFVILENL